MGTFSWAFYAIRNRAKKCSLTTCGAVFLLLKTTFDSISRILIFSSWLYVVHEGQFSSTKTVIAYYSTFTIIMIFNTFFNKSNCSKINWIGIILNSSSSVLSYNNFNFEYIIINTGSDIE